MSDGTIDDVKTDELFVALTRPATFAGVPYTAFVLEFIAVMIVFLAVGNPLYMLLMVPLHAVLYAISANDPGVFDSVLVWFKTLGKSRNTAFWGGASFSPLRTKKWDL